MADKSDKNKLPKAPRGTDEYASLEKDECRKCCTFKGKNVLRPCGHGLFCNACVNKLRNRGAKMKFFGPMCLHPDCPVSVKGWITLKNVNDV